MKLTSNEKAFAGGLLAFLATLIVQLQQSGQLTLKEAGWSVGAWVIVHLGVWVTTNTPATFIPVGDINTTDASPPEVVASDTPSE